MGTRVYLGRISYNVREKDIERFFRGYGRLRDIIIKNGYGFVDFEDYRDADDAVYELSGKDLCGERVRLELARGPSRSGGGGGGGGRGGGGGGSYRRRPNWLDKYGPPTRTDFRVVVENLSSRVSWQDLKDYMRQAGEVTYADAHRPNKNEGYVEFTTLSDMKKALDKLDGTEINGRKIKITEDRPKKRSRSRSRGRRSHSRSRSRSRRRSHSRSRSRSSSRSRSRSRDRGRSRSRSASRSRSPERRRSNSRNYARDDSDDD